MFKMEIIKVEKDGNQNSEAEMVPILWIFLQPKLLSDSLLISWLHVQSSIPNQTLNKIQITQHMKHMLVVFHINGCVLH